MTLSERVLAVAAQASPSVKARLDAAHVSRVLSVAKDGSANVVDGDKTNKAFTSWENLFPDESTATGRSRAPYEFTQTASGQWRVRVYVPETGSVLGAVGRTKEDAVTALEKTTGGAK